MLFVAHFSINYRTNDRQIDDLAKIVLDPLADEDIPETIHPVTPPPVISPPVIPDDFDIKEDEDDVVEDIIDSTEDDPDEPIVDIADVVVDEPEEDVEVIWTLIEDVPIFPGCENVSKDERRVCMSDKITKHVQKKFNTDLANDLGLNGKQKILGMFKIDKNGEIVGVQSRAPHPRLEEEAARVINLLPKMKPGKQRGETVTVKYSLPIIFQVQN